MPADAAIFHFRRYAMLIFILTLITIFLACFAVYAAYFIIACHSMLLRFLLLSILICVIVV